MYFENLSLASGNCLEHFFFRNEKYIDYDNNNR